MRMSKIFPAAVVIGMLITGAAFSPMQADPPPAAQGQSRPRPAMGRRAAPAPNPASLGDLQEARQVPPSGLQLPAPTLTRVAILRLLNLTPEQMRRVQDVRRRFGPQLERLRQQVQDRRDALRQATYGERLDLSLLEQGIRELIEAESELIRLETQLEVEFRNILTPEQLAQFREIQNEELAIRQMRREARQREQRLQERLRRALQRPPQM